MMGHTQIAVTARERFMQAVNEELTRFEQKETEFRRHERRDRAAELNMPADSEAGSVRS
jgi:hypothetical protein